MRVRAVVVIVAAPEIPDSQAAYLFAGIKNDEVLADPIFYRERLTNLIGANCPRPFGGVAPGLYLMWDLSPLHAPPK
jgi:hypothetical protein